MEIFEFVILSSANLLNCDITENIKEIGGNISITFILVMKQGVKSIVIKSLSTICYLYTNHARVCDRCNSSEVEGHVSIVFYNTSSSYR